MERSPLLILAIAACSSHVAAPVANAFDDPVIELPVVVINKDVGPAMHTQATVGNDYDAWCKARGGAKCSRLKKTGEGHAAEVFRYGNDLYLAIEAMGGSETAGTPIRLDGEPDAIDLVIEKTDGGIPLWKALLTVRRGATWYAQVCSWDGYDGCTLPLSSTVAAPTLEGARLVTRGASVIRNGTAERIPDQTYVLFVP